jgi:N-acetylneuraminate synthase
MAEVKHVYIVAEAGVNHNGSLEMAKELVDVAAEAGADAVKFQSFKADKVISSRAPKAEYQTRTTDASESQLDMVKKLELDERAHQVLIAYCKAQGIQFLSTPFDLDSLDLLVRNSDQPYLKVASGETINAPLLLKIASTGKPVLLSTGMCTLGEIETALGVLAFGYGRSAERPSPMAFQAAYCSASGQQALQEKVILLHCTTEYPAPFNEINLCAMDTMRAAFALPVGYSDHSIGIAVPIAAAALGAVVIEKHFTLDKNLPGPDHEASLEPEELKQMVRSIRQIEMALGSPMKIPSPGELKNIPIVRKSIVAAQDIRQGELFTEDNITTKRPGDGMHPILYWDLLGKAAEQNYRRDDLISRTSKL